MKLDKAKSRDKKRNKKKNGMRISGKSIFTIVETQVKKSDEIDKEKKKKRNNGIIG